MLGRASREQPVVDVGDPADAASSESATAAAAPPPASKKRKAKAQAAERSATQSDAEFGVARGVDFCDVTAVINMDLPASSAVYRHRIGRTARAGQGGTAISMVDDKDPADDALLAELLGAYEGELHQFHVDMSKLGAFRYRVEDAMRSVTRAAVKEARLKEIKQELLHSKQLAEHFDANPDDLKALRHDKPLATVRKQPHLANVPTYLRPDTENATAAVAAVSSSSRLRAVGKKRATFGKSGKKKDPLRSLGKGVGGGRGKGGRGGKRRK